MERKHITTKKGMKYGFVLFVAVLFVPLLGWGQTSDDYSGVYYIGSVGYNSSTPANNYYLYFNGTHLTGYKFYFIPFDYDNTLGTSLGCGNQSDAGRQDPLHWGVDNNRLIARILKYDDFKAKYVACLKELVKPGMALMDRASAQARIRSWQALIGPYVDNDTGEDTFLEDKPAPRPPRSTPCRSRIACRQKNHCPRCSVQRGQLLCCRFTFKRGPGRSL